jgi:hypothetical protein
MLAPAKNHQEKNVRWAADNELSGLFNSPTEDLKAKQKDQYLLQ